MNEKKSNRKLYWLIFVIILAFVVVGFVTGKVKITPKEVDNYAPTITYNYDTSLNSEDGRVTVVVGINDKDNDKMNIQFFVRDNPSDEWIGIGNFDGYDGEYHVVTGYIRNSDSDTQTAHWRVQVTDYNEYISKEYTFKYGEKA